VKRKSRTVTFLLLLRMQEQRIKSNGIKDKCLT
jgi:hypothetical protein